MPHLDLKPKDNISSFRKIALGTWRDAYDPSVYGSMELNMDEAMRYVSDFRRQTGKRLTVSHLMAKAMAAALRATPDANAILRFNRIYHRQSIGVFFQVVMTDQGEEKIDLSGATLYGIDEKPLVQVIDEFEQKVQAVRARQDPALEKSRGLMHRIPYLLIHWFLRFVGFLSYTLNLDLRAFGIPRDPFGSAMITNVGSLGLDTAYVPLVPYSRVPILLALGAVHEAAVVREGKLAVGKVMRVNATFDHRLIDGFHAASMSRVLRAWMEQPYQHFDRLERETPAATS